MTKAILLQIMPDDQVAGIVGHGTVDAVFTEKEQIEKDRQQITDVLSFLSDISVELPDFHVVICDDTLYNTILSYFSYDLTTELYQFLQTGKFPVLT